MNELSCMSLFEFLVDKLKTICPLYSESNRNLPRELLLNILVRLPAQSAVGCMDKSFAIHDLVLSTPSFIETHFHRSDPVIAFVYFVGWKMMINFTDETAKRITTKPTEVDCSYSTTFPLICSYNGFLLFGYSNETCVRNPITKKIVTVSARVNHTPYGIYVHPPTMEYRILFLEAGSVPSKGYTYGLMSQCKTVIANSSHPPACNKPPVILNGALHWMVNDSTYKNRRDVWPDCSNAIILFHIIAENFSTIPHPGNRCGLRKEHYKMELMEMKGCLWLCDVSSKVQVDIWVLEDYENRVWARRHVVMIEPLRLFCGIQQNYGSHVFVGGFHGFNEELLMKVSDNHLILYNLQLGTIRKVKKHPKNVNFVAVPHVNSMFLDVY